MSKKQKRQVSRQYPTAQGKVDVVMDKTPGSSSRMVNAEFNPDYTYVKKDLKVIGTLAVTFFVILIALSFIIK